MKKLVVLLGSQGLLGKGLYERYSKENTEIITVDNIDNPQINQDEDYNDVNLTDKVAVNDFINYVKQDIDENDYDEVSFHFLAANLSPFVLKEKTDYLVNELKLIQNFMQFIETNFGIESKYFYYSTSEIYGNVSMMDETGIMKHELVESDTFMRDRYHVLKITGEYLFRETLENNNKNGVIIRPFNVVGKDQRDTFVIPRMIKKAEEEGVIEVFDDGNQSRNFIHIETFSETIYRIDEKWNELLEKGYYSINVANIVNVITMNELAQKIANIYKYGKNKEVEVKKVQVERNLIGQTERVPSIRRILEFIDIQLLMQKNIDNILKEFILDE